MAYNDQEIEEFKSEAFDLLENAEKSLLALDQGADFKTSFDCIFRGFHNLKGAAGMMEFHKLQAHTHELENKLMALKDADSIPKETINLFLRGIDAAKSLLSGQDVDFDFSTSIETAAASAEHSSPSEGEAQVADAKPELPQGISQDVIDEFVSECDEIIERISKNLQLIEAGNHTRESLDEIYRDVHSLKGSAYLFSFQKLGDIAHAMESSLERVRGGTHLPSEDLINGLFKALEIIESIVQKIKNKTYDEELESTIPIFAKTLLSFAAKLERAPEDPLLSAGIQPSSAHAEPARAPREKEAEGASSIRVPVALLDNLMTLMGEMVLVRNQVLQFSNKSEDLEFLSMSKRLNVVTSEIQGEMMKTRMQPIGNVLSKFNRVVRDLSQDLKKNINLSLVGADTELDKSLLEAIKDPLTHIVRNSCDHGIESPETRQQHGKPETGSITIKAYHEGGQVIIDVHDDGAGLQRDVILKKAIEKGHITQAESLKLSEKQAFNLIFTPGFSTASKVTNVSGRGVGMDVVRTNIEKIGGTVDLSSVPGSGTTIKLKIPLTLAIVPALIVKCGKGTFAIPQVKLEELVRVDQSSSENKIECLHGAPVFRLRGNILPLVDLNQVLNIGGQTNYQDGIINIAVLNAEQVSFGLIIDEVQDTADIVVKPLNRLLKSLQVYSGATILGNGSVALILDVLGVSKVAHLGHDKAKSLESEAQDQKRSRSSNDRQDYLLVEVNSPTKHAIVLGYVHRLEEFKREDIEYSGSLPVIRYRDVILPIISANEQLGYGKKKTETEIIPIVVIQRAGSLYGIEVDRILDTLSTSADLDSSHVRQPGIFGSLNTSEELIVVIDPIELIGKALALPAGNLAQLPKRASGRGRILVAEDTVFFRKAIRSVLEKTGYEVITANDGKDAMDLLTQDGNTFDLIVSDIEMPRLNGFRLAEAIRKNPKLSATPLLAVSSRAEKGFVAEGMKAGFDLYLEKLKPDTLLEAVTELINRKRSAA